MSVRGVLRSKTFAVLLGVGLVVAILWVVLPAMATSYVNRRLANLEDYTGEVESVSFHLLRGAYRVKDIDLRSRRAPKEPFFSASAIDLSLDGGALLDGNLVAEIDVREPVLDYVAVEEKEEPEKTWQETMAELAPFRIDRLTIHDGDLSYRSAGASKSARMTLSDVDAVARNLTNSADLADSMFARFQGTGVALGSGNLSFQGRANPSAKRPTFDLEFDLEELALKDATGLLASTAGFRPEGGTLSMDADLSAAGGRVKGMSRASLSGMRVTDIGREDEGLAGQLWDRARKVAEPHVGKQRSSNVRVRVPIDTRLDDPAGGIMAAAAEVMQAAMREAIRQSFGDVLSLPGRPREN